MANKALRFVAAAVLARALSEKEFGRFNIGIAIAGVVVTLCSLGLAEVGARDLARRPDDAANLAGSVLVARLAALAIVATVGLATVALLRPHDLGFGAVIVAMSVFMVTTGEWVARGLERMGRVALGTAAGGAAAVIGAFVILATSDSAVAALGLFAVAELVASSVYWTAARGWRPRPNTRGLTRLLRESWPIALSSIAVFTFYANIDTIILGAARGEAEAGVYSAAYRVFLAFNVLAIFGAYSLYPIISRARELRTVGDVIERAGRFLEALVVYGAIVVGAAILIAHPMLRALFGPGYGRGGDALVLLSISTSWYCVGYTVGYNLIAIERSRRFSLGAAVAGLLALVLDVVLIPPWGIIGAAAATTASIIAATAIWIGPDGAFTPVGASLVGPLLALTGLGVVALAWPASGTVIGVAVLAASAAGAFVLARRHR